MKKALGEEAQTNIGNCCSVFFLIGFVALIVGKFDGADYISIWIIFPLLLFVGTILCCLAFCIFTADEKQYKEAIENGGFGPEFGGAPGGGPGGTKPRGAKRRDGNTIIAVVIRFC